MRRVYLLNEDKRYGGAEVYTHFFARALVASGYAVTLLIRPGVDHWNRLDLTGIDVQSVATVEEVERTVPADSLLVVHSRLAVAWLERLMRRGNVVIVAHHIPLEPGSCPDYPYCNLLFVVSQYVHDLCAQHGHPHIYPVPLLGIGEITKATSDTEIRRNDRYVWEPRNRRDWVLSKLYSLYTRHTPVVSFERRPGMTLGVVSRIAPIKQFDVLFRHLAPVLARHPEINIEIFGSGKYKLVRALERALRPLGKRVRYWGWQWNVAAIYPHLDYLLSGLPEQETLGLNVIEAQFCGTPVLAPRAPPFIETVLDGRTGYLYRDPREDGGVDFERVLGVAARVRPDPRLMSDHLERFQFAAFAGRVAAAIEYAHARLLRPIGITAEGA